MKKEIYPNIDNCKPIECISGKMMRCNRIIANIFRKHLITHNITDSQLSILFYVSKSKNVTQKELSDFLAMEKSTVNRNIKRLKEASFISSDNNKLFNTTKKGLDVLENIIPAWNNAMEESKKVLGDIGIESLNLIHNLLIDKE